MPVHLRASAEDVYDGPNAVVEKTFCCAVDEFLRDAVNSYGNAPLFVAVFNSGGRPA